MSRPLFLPVVPARKLTTLQGLVATILCLWLSVFLHLPLYNAGGGEGGWLPWNIVAWGVAVSVILVTALMAPAGRLIITPGTGLFFLAVALLTLPLIWCPVPDWIIYSLPRLYGLWGGAVFYLALLQCRFTDRIKRLFLWCVTFAALVQGLTVLAGLFRPSLLPALSQTFITAIGRSALGVFEQVNVTASFLATGFALSLALFYRISLRPAGAGLPARCRLQSVYLLALMALLPCVLVLTRSRIGWLGGLCVYSVAVVTALLTARRPNGRPRGAAWRTVAITVMPLAGIVAGLLLLNVSVAQAIDHGGSNHQRWLTLKATWEMIRLHPWAGWGTGSFMMQFQHYMASHYHPNPSRELMGHPHNEILYVWMEGGIVALAGLVAMGGAVGILLVKNRAPARRLMAMAMLPVLLHTMVEYPLYLSTPHALTLLLIALNLDRAGRGTVPGPEWGHAHGIMRTGAEAHVRCIVVVAAFWLLTSLHDVYRTNALLAHYESGELSSAQTLREADIPWLLRSRYDADRLNMDLDAYTRTGDLRLLQGYVRDNARWLRTHTDPDNYVSQVDVLHYLHRDAEACRYQREGRALYPQDTRLGGNGCR